MINWLKKIWNWLKSLFNTSSDAIETDDTLSQPSLSDAEYESVLFALLAAIKKGRSWGSCQGFLISRNIKPDQLAEWIEKKSLEWFDNKDNYQQLGQDLEELSNIASGKLGNIARNVSSEFGVRGSEFGNFQENNLQNTESNRIPSETKNTTPSQTTTDKVQTLMNQNENLELFELGLQYIEEENYQTSLDVFEQMISIDPNNMDAWIQKGIVLEKLGRYTEAIEANNRVISCYPNSQKNQSEKNIEKIVKFEVDNYPNWFEQGIALDNLGRFDEAIASYDKALQLKPDLYQAWKSRGRALYNLGRFDEAIASYDKALQLKPDYYEAWNNRGVALCNLGRFDEAIASYDKVLQLKPDYYEAWGNRGIALRQLGRLDEAIASYDKALQLKPDDHQAWNNRGVALCIAVAKAIRTFFCSLFPVPCSLKI